MLDVAKGDLLRCDVWVSDYHVARDSTAGGARWLNLTNSPESHGRDAVPPAGRSIARNPTVLTTLPNEVVQRIHDRMSAIFFPLPTTYADPAMRDVDRVRDILGALPRRLPDDRTLGEHAGAQLGVQHARVHCAPGYISLLSKPC